MNTLKTFVAASAAFVALATVSVGPASATELTADQHPAAAHELAARAAAANDKAAAHQVMARAGGAPKANRQAMANHCERLIAQYRAEADALAAAAAEHQGLATSK